MKTNVGKTDKIIRFIIAIILSGLYVSGIVKGTLGIVLLVAGIVLAATGAIGFCGLYTLLGINTCPTEKK